MLNNLDCDSLAQTPKFKAINQEPLISALNRWDKYIVNPLSYIDVSLQNDIIQEDGKG